MRNNNNNKIKTTGVSEWSQRSGNEKSEEKKYKNNAPTRSPPLVPRPSLPSLPQSPPPIKKSAGA